MSETTEVIETIDRVRNKARDIAAILQAIYEGKTVQYLPDGKKAQWTDWTYPSKLPETQWLYGMKWRIKPEPKTWWLQMNEKGHVIAATLFDPSGMQGEWIKVREVEP